MKTLIAARPTKAIDQSAQAANPGGYYVRIDDRSTWTQQFGDAQASALSMSTVYACVRVLAESVASLPFVLYRRLPNGGKDRATDHPLYSVLHDQPNPSMTSFVWRELLMSHVATWGNHDSEIAFDELGRMQLWPIRPDRMEYRWGPNGERRYFYLSPAGIRDELDPRRIFHVSGLSSNGLSGLSPIALHAKTLRLAETAQEFGTAFFNNGARPATVLSHPNTLSAPAITRLATQMEELRGSRNAGKTVVLEEGLTVTEVGVPPQDAQYIETRKFQRSVIASEIFRIPPHKIGDLEHATFSNIEHQAIEFVVDTLRPWLVRIEQECKAQLFYDEDVFPEFLVDGLLRGDASARATALATRWQHGTLTADEWREIENENPLPDGIGKQTYIPENYKPAITAEAAAAEQAAEAAAPVDPGAPPQLVAVKSTAVRCDKGHLLAEMATPPYRFTCPKCKSVKSADGPESEAPELADGLKAALRSLAEPPIVHVPAPIVNVTTAPPDMTEVAGAIRDMTDMIDDMNPPRPRTIRRVFERDADNKIIAMTEVS